METRKCHDCPREVVFLNGMPSGAQIAVCHECGEKRRRREAAKPDFAGFSRDSSPLLIDGQVAAISMTTRIN